VLQKSHADHEVPWHELKKIGLVCSKCTKNYRACVISRNNKCPVYYNLASQITKFVSMQLLLAGNRVYVNNQHSLQELQDNIYYMKRNCQFFNKRALTGGDRYFQKVRALLRSSRSAFPESPVQYCTLNFRTWTLNSWQMPALYATHFLQKLLYSGTLPVGYPAVWYTIDRSAGLQHTTEVYAYNGFD